MTIKNITHRRWLMVNLARKNIWLNWRHSFATMMAIVSGFVAIALFDGFIDHLHDIMVESYVYKAMLGHLYIEKLGASEHATAEPWEYGLTLNDQKFIQDFLKNEEGVAAVNRFLFVSGIISNGNSNVVFAGAGYDIEEGVKFRGRSWKWNTVSGMPLHLAKEPSVAIGLGLASRLDCEPEKTSYLNPDGTYLPQSRPLNCARTLLQLSTSTEHSQINALDIKLGGTLDMQLREYNDRFVAMPLDIAQKLLDTDKVTRIAVLAENPSVGERVIAAFNRAAKNSSYNLRAYPWIDHPSALIAKGGIEILGVFRSLFLTIVAVIACMSVANTMMKSVNERIREIGALRSVGFRRSDIITLFTMEGLFIGLYSCLLGIIVATIAAFLISSSGVTMKAGIMSSALTLKVTFVLSMWILSAFTLSILSAGAAWLVSRRVAKMEVAEALRYIS